MPLNMNIRFEDFDGRRLMVVKCSQSTIPVFVKDDKSEKFFIRTGPSTTELLASQILEYGKKRFG